MIKLVVIAVAIISTLAALVVSVRLHDATDRYLTNGDNFESVAAAGAGLGAALLVGLVSLVWLVGA